MIFLRYFLSKICFSLLWGVHINLIKSHIRSFVLRPTFHYCHKSVLFEEIGLIIGSKYISIGKNVTFQKFIYLTAWNNPYSSKSPKLIINDNCSFGAFNHITCYNNIHIGKGLLTGKWVTITDNSHGDTDFDSLKIPPHKRKIVSKGPVIIGENVWMGDKVTILPNTTIGDGVIIAANSVVTQDIPPYCIAGGNPAKILKNYKRSI